MRTEQIADYYEIIRPADQSHTPLRGHYSAVFEANDRIDNRRVALKVMRSRHLTATDALLHDKCEAFATEVEILEALGLDRDVRAVSLLSFGYIAANDGDEDRLSGNEAIQITTNRRATMFTVDTLKNKCRNGWRPFLALEFLPPECSFFDDMRYVGNGALGDNLRVFHHHYPFAVAAEAFRQCVAFFSHLQDNYGFYYVDHKLPHIYWMNQKIKVIDFNGGWFKREQPKEFQEIRAWTGKLAQSKTDNAIEFATSVMYPMLTAHLLYAAIDGARFRDASGNAIIIPSGLGHAGNIAAFFDQLRAEANTPTANPLATLKELLGKLAAEYGFRKSGDLEARQAIDGLYSRLAALTQTVLHDIETAWKSDPPDPYWSELEHLYTLIRELQSNISPKLVLPGITSSRE